MRNMKEILFLLTAILFTFSLQAQDTLKLITYNVRNANGMDGVISFRRVANVINNASPDVVAIQEVDSMTNRSRAYVCIDRNSRTYADVCLLCTGH